MNEDNKKFISKYNIEVDPEWLEEFHISKDIMKAPKGHNWKANQLLVFNNTALGRYLIESDSVKKISGNKKSLSIYGVSPRGFEQMSALDAAMDEKIQLSFFTGIAGSGKTLVACQAALDLLFKRDVDRIILTRPAVTAGEDIGFLPGDKDAKLAPYTAAIYDNMYRLYKKEIIDKHIQDGHIEVIPLAFMRGRNLSDCVVVVDEAQNITDRQMELLLGRLCNGSKMILCGDAAQIDLKDKNVLYKKILDKIKILETLNNKDFSVIFPEMQDFLLLCKQS